MDSDLENFDFELYSVKNVKAVFNRNLKELDSRKVVENSCLIGNQPKKAEEKDVDSVNITSTGKTSNDIVEEIQPLPVNSTSSENRLSAEQDEISVVPQVKQRQGKTRKKSLENPDVVVEDTDDSRSTVRRSARIRRKNTGNTPRTIISLDSPPALTPQRGRRRANKKTTKLKLDKSIQEIVIIEDDVSVVEDVDEDNDCNENITVKVLWKTNTVKKFSVRKFQKLETVFRQLAVLENVNVSRIMLTLRGTNVRYIDTPDSLNLKVIDFLEGGVITGVVQPQIETPTDDSLCAKGVISLKFQDSKGKYLHLKVGLKDKMKTVMTKCAEQLDLSLNQIKFSLDGDNISFSDTPQDLGLEGDEIIEIKYVQ